MIVHKNFILQFFSLFLGKVLVRHIVEIFQEYDLSDFDVKSNIIFLSDRGPNIKWGLISSVYHRLTCYAHIIHNLISAMINEEKVKSIVDKWNCYDT